MNILRNSPLYKIWFEYYWSWCRKTCIGTPSYRSSLVLLRHKAYLRLHSYIFFIYTERWTYIFYTFIFTTQIRSRTHLYTYGIYTNILTTYKYTNIHVSKQIEPYTASYTIEHIELKTQIHAEFKGLHICITMNMN